MRYLALVPLLLLAAVAEAGSRASVPEESPAAVGVGAVAAVGEDSAPLVEAGVLLPVMGGVGPALDLDTLSRVVTDEGPAFDFNFLTPVSSAEGPGLELESLEPVLSEEGPEVIAELEPAPVDAAPLVEFGLLAAVSLSGGPAGIDVPLLREVGGADERNDLATVLGERFLSPVWAVRRRMRAARMAGDADEVTRLEALLDAAVAAEMEGGAE